MEIIRWSRHILYGVLMAGMTGSISYACILLMGKLKTDYNPHMKLAMIKATILLAIMPIVLPLIYLSRISYSGGGFRHRGDLFGGSTNIVAIATIAALFIWIAGSLICLSMHLMSLWELHVMKRGNVPVEPPLWAELLDEYKEKYSYKNVSLVSNDLIRSPIAAGIFRPLIIIPYAGYRKKHMHMILEHELHHIRKRDLLWKRLAIAAECLHWMNPLFRKVSKELIFEEEVVCDIYASSQNKYYTREEYMRFLGGMEGGPGDGDPSSFCEIQYYVFRRIRIMKDLRRITKPTRKALFLAIAAIVAVSVTPSYVMAEQLAQLQEGWIAATEERTPDEGQGTDDSLVEHTGKADDSLTEIVLNEGVATMSRRITLDGVIPKRTRIIYSYQMMSQGEQVVITTGCDTDDEYDIGIKNISNGDVLYVRGSGTMTHIFTVPEDGLYAAYVQNYNSYDIYIFGIAIYP